MPGLFTNQWEQSTPSGAQYRVAASSPSVNVFAPTRGLTFPIDTPVLLAQAPVDGELFVRKLRGGIDLSATGTLGASSHLYLLLIQNSVPFAGAGTLLWCLGAFGLPFVGSNLPDCVYAGPPEIEDIRLRNRDAAYAAVSSTPEVFTPIVGTNAEWWVEATTVASPNIAPYTFP